MNLHQAQAIVDMVQSHADTYPGETAEAKASAYYNEAVDSLWQLHSGGTCMFHVALGRQGVRPRVEEC